MIFFYDNIHYSQLILQEFVIHSRIASVSALYSIVYVIPQFTVKQLKFGILFNDYFLENSISTIHVGIKVLLQFVVYKLVFIVVFILLFTFIDCFSYMVCVSQ